jgi:erythronate-4-phosphate dehydrogenase
MVTLIIDDHIPFIKGVFEPFANVIYAKGGRIDRNLALKADGLIIRTRTQCDARLLEGTPVRFIATATIGHDHIDAEYCKNNDIQWFHAPGCNSGSVMQYIGSVLANLQMKHGIDLRDKKIGIIGAGHVGSKVAKLSNILGMVTLVNDPPRARLEGGKGFVSLEKIIASADIITFHVPLTNDGEDKTFHMADQDFFNNLSNKPFIINTSRGAVMDATAVKDAIKNGQISGFIADVWENEPLLDLELLSLSLIGTPHIAGYSAEGKANGTSVCVRAASRFFGFGIDNWSPTALPQSLNTVIQLDTNNKESGHFIEEAILSSYDVTEDDHELKKEPSQFEHLRNFYRTRREFSAFTIQLPEYLPDLISSLNSIGFKTIIK